MPPPRRIAFAPSLAAGAFSLVAACTAALGGAPVQGFALCCSALLAGCNAWWSLGPDGDHVG
jgi:hypothetical protein